MAELYEELMRKELVLLYWLLGFGGVWPSDSTNPLVHIGHKMWGIFASVYYVLITLSEFIFMINNTSGFQEVVDVITPFFMTITALFKLCYLFWKRDYIVRLFRQFLFMDYGFFMPYIKEVQTNPALWERGKTGEFKNYLDESMKKSLKECRFLFFTLGGSLATTLVEFLIVGLALSFYYHNTEGPHETLWVLPFNTAVPWDWKQPINYTITWFLHLLASAITMQGFGMDLLFGSLMVMMNRQYTALGIVLGGLDQFAEIYRTDNGRRLVDGQEPTPEEFQAIDDACYKLLVECVEHYDRLLMECNQIDMELGFVFLTQFIHSSLTLCLVTYKASTEKEIGPMAICLAFFFAASFQLLLYCYYGQRMLQLGENLGELAYQIPWMDRSLKFQHAVRMLIRQSQRQMRITAWGFSDLSLPTFTSILSSAMSYFTLLRSVDQENQ